MNKYTFFFPKEAWDKLNQKTQDAIKNVISEIEVTNYFRRREYMLMMGAPYPETVYPTLNLDTSLTYAQMIEDPKDRKIKELEKQVNELNEIKKSIEHIKKFTESV